MIDNRQRNRKNLRRLAPILGVALLALLLVFKLPSWIAPHVKSSRIRTTHVLSGSIEATVTASGNVIPANEHILSCPIETRLTALLKQVGDIVAEGEPIVVLDTGETRLVLSRLDEEIALKENERERTRLQLEETLIDLDSRLAIKSLELESLRLTRSRNEQLFDIGGISRMELDASAVDVERAVLEVAKLEKQRENARHRSLTQVARLDLELGIQVQERDEARRRLELATAKADRPGVLTWLPSHEGVALHAGEELARIADLSAFRVEARLSDAHADRLWQGQVARVQMGDDFLTGRVSSIYPAVEAGIVRLLIDLDASDHPKLRPNLRVEAHLVTDRREGTLKMKRGAYVRAGGRPAVFVVRDGVAHRTPVEFGITNFDDFEILSGLEPGDEVIQSDMSDYAHLQEVRIR